MNRFYFHGTTSKKKADSILKNGFNKGTFFADHLEDALGFGGNHIFWVWLDFKFKRGKRPKMYSWQVISANHIKPEFIKKYEIYQKPKLIYNH